MTRHISALDLCFLRLMVARIVLNMIVQLDLILQLVVPKILNSNIISQFAW